jgi:hypothetical protein
MQLKTVDMENKKESMACRKIIFRHTALKTSEPQRVDLYKYELILPHKRPFASGCEVGPVTHILQLAGVQTLNMTVKHGGDSPVIVARVDKTEFLRGTGSRP